VQIIPSATPVPTTALPSPTPPAPTSTPQALGPEAIPVETTFETASPQATRSPLARPTGSP
jgi:hypothetical protein